MIAIIEKYIELRDRKQEISNTAKEKIAQIDTVLAQLEAAILQDFQANGFDSVKTEKGTAYRSTRTSATVADWDTFLDFVKDNQLWNMLEKRCAKATVEQYKDIHGDLPAGVNWREEVVINVRRSA